MGTKTNIPTLEIRGEHTQRSTYYLLRKHLLNNYCWPKNKSPFKMGRHHAFIWDFKKERERTAMQETLSQAETQIMLRLRGKGNGYLREREGEQSINRRKAFLLVHMMWHSGFIFRSLHIVLWDTMLIRSGLKVILSRFNIPEVWGIRCAKQFLCHEPKNLSRQVRLHFKVGAFIICLQYCVSGTLLGKKFIAEPLLLGSTLSPGNTAIEQVSIVEMQVYRESQRKLL